MTSAATILAKGLHSPLDDNGYNGVSDAWSNLLPTVTTAMAPKAGSTALYLQEFGDSSLISVNDIHQGQIGDCFLLSSIGEIALWHPSYITNMIQVNANGTETVTLYLSASGQLPTYSTTSFKATTVTIDNTFPGNVVNNGATQDVVNGQKEIWVQVLEKAVATLNGGYNYIANGGNPMIAMKELVGQSATYMSSASLTLGLLQSFVAAGDLIVMDTYSSGTLPYGLYNNHAYMFEGVTMVNGAPMVQLGNPWGCYQPSLIPLSSLSSGVVEVDIGQFTGSNTITGTTGNDTIVLSAPVINASIDLGAGFDKLTFANGTNSATVANTEVVLGGTGDDTITLATALTTATSIDLGGGSNKLTLQASGNTGVVSNVSTLVGSAGADSISYASILVNGSVDLGAGGDTLRLANFTNRVSVANTETIIGGSGSDTIVLTTLVTNASIDLGAGSDALTFASGTNSATVANTETILGGTGDDAITLATALTTAMSVDLGGGSNKLILQASGNTGTVSNVTTLIGSTAGDSISYGSSLMNGSVDLGAGNDTLRLFNSSNRISVANTETIIGGGGSDTILLTTPATNASIDLGAGSDSLTLANGTNSATVANTEVILGGTGNDTVTLATALTTSMSVDLGAGSNKLTLAATTNTGMVGNVTTLVGGSGNDSITYGSSAVNASVDLGAGQDTLRLANGTNRVSVAGTETVIGGSGNDTILLTGSTAAMVIGGGGMNFITGNAAADLFVFDQHSLGAYSTVTNFNAAKGDRIALDTTGSSTLAGNAYDLGGAQLTLNRDLTDVANLAKLLSTTLNNGGKGGFAYEHDTGQLFYTSNGSFAHGGTLVGIITTNGTTPWTFNANSFVQV